MRKQKAEFSIPSQGREPPPLDDAKLAAIERVGFGDPFAARQKREALEIDPAKAQAMIERLAFDVGEVRPNPDFGTAKTRKERQAVDDEHSRLVHARFQRHETITSLHAHAARDLAFQSHTFAALSKVPADFRDDVFGALVTSKELAPELLAEARRLVRKPSLRAASAAVAIFRREPETIAPLIESVDRKNANALQHAKMLVELGTKLGAWAAAPDTWRKVLEPLTAWMANWDPSEGDLGRARWQLGHAAKEALESKKKVAPPPKAKPKKSIAITKPPLDKKLLRTNRGREKALDALGAWLATSLAKADDAAARATIAGAIGAFYDIREAAEQERGEYAGHFFMVDAVGLDNTDRPVPWNVLRKTVGEERLEELSALFDEVLPEVD